MKAIEDAPGFAAVVEALEREAATGKEAIPSILLSAGDNYIPGPFFSAAADEAGMRGVLRKSNQEIFGLPDLISIREGIGRVDITIMNLLGFDTSVLGNHEFDLGTETLKSIVSVDARGSLYAGVRWLGAQFPYLSANLEFSGDPNLRGIYTDRILPSSSYRFVRGHVGEQVPKIAPATTIELRWRDGVETVGIIGVTTPLLESISSPGETRVRNGAAGNDMEALAVLLQPVIDDVIDGTDDKLSTADDVNKVVLLSHLQQIRLERQLLGYLRGVDVVIAGGSDTLLAARGDPLRSGDVVEGPYPTTASDRDGDPAVIVSTEGRYKYVGRLLIEFDLQGRIVGPVTSVDDWGSQGSGVFATDEDGVVRLWGDLADAFKPGTKGAQVRFLTEAVREIVSHKDSNIIGSTSVFLEGRRRFVRTEETNLGSLSADANRFLAQRTVGHTGPPLVSIMNGGGIRSAIGTINREGTPSPPQSNPVSGKNEGEISQLDVENALRFNNGLSVLILTAGELKAILEHAVAATSVGHTPGRFPQVSGMAFSFDPGRPEGDRIRTLVILDEGVCGVLVQKGRLVIDGEFQVRVVTPDFLADGGDGYPFPVFGQNRRDLVGDPGVPVGIATFTVPGSEQDALAEFLAAEIDRRFEHRDTPVAEDKRIQNLQSRTDTVIESWLCERELV